MDIGASAEQDFYHSNVAMARRYRQRRSLTVVMPIHVHSAVEQVTNYACATRFCGERQER
jgi:hypothetical protein